MAAKPWDGHDITLAMDHAGYEVVYMSPDVVEGTADSGTHVTVLSSGGSTPIGEIVERDGQWEFHPGNPDSGYVQARAKTTTTGPKRESAPTVGEASSKVFIAICNAVWHAGAGDGVWYGPARADEALAYQDAEAHEHAGAYVSPYFV